MVFQTHHTSVFHSLLLTPLHPLATTKHPSDLIYPMSIHSRSLMSASLLFSPVFTVVTELS